MYKVDPKDLEQFPDYDNNPRNFVGSKEYWKGVFSLESNRDPQLHKAFRELHGELVNRVIQFCKEHNLDGAYEFTIGASGLTKSIPEGQWTPYTDSYFIIANINDEGKLEKMLFSH